MAMDLDTLKLSFLISSAIIEDNVIARRRECMVLDLGGHCKLKWWTWSLVNYLNWWTCVAIVLG